MVRVGVKLLPALVTLIIFLSGIHQVFAISSPTLSSPSDGSTTSSSSLSWQAVDGATQYRIIVDDESSTSSPYIRDYRTDNTSYSPQIGPGTYYWKVEVRDSAGTWSQWSPTWSFTLTSSESTPAPSSEPSTNPSSSPNSSPDASSSPTSSFTISGVPSQVDVSQSFPVNVTLVLPNNPNTLFYLKGAFKKTDGSNYFGQTKVGSIWIKNGASYSSQLQITTDSSGHWSGNLDVQPDNTDSGFTGSGDYTFKVGRYSSSGSGPTWSTELTMKLTGQQGAEQTTQSSSHSTPSPKASSAVKGTTTTPPSQSSSNSSYRNSKGSSYTSTASESAVPSPTSGVEVKGEKKFNILPLIGGILILVGLASVGFIIFRKKISTKL